MTNNKLGSVNQQPLYVCTSCISRYEDSTWPAGDLRVHSGECWCYPCWDERQWDFPEQPDWNDLEPYTPAEQKPAPDVARLVVALEKARDAIGSLPQDALGNVPDTQQRQGWHIRDELINEISTALAAYRKQGGEV